jgi:GT2 family glycosyltransferase
MPFLGDAEAAASAIGVLRSLAAGPEDQLILADNSGLAPTPRDVTVVRASDERSPAHARNVGAQHARCDWLLFLDADCRPEGDLLGAYFSERIAGEVGALAGEVVPAPGEATLAARYAAARSFLSQQAHLAHPYRPRAVAANLLVRRVAFEQVGGFYEGVRAAEDTDFSWRLQQAGWRLDLRPQARAAHRYRPTVAELRRQWRGYAAGRAWLARRYPGFRPEPALRRAVRRGWWLLRARGARGQGLGARSSQPPGADARRLDRAGYLALDAVLGFEELAGFALSNRPARLRKPSATVVLVAKRFPARDDPLVEFARTLGGARVEAAARPEVADLDVMRELQVDYREDDGAAARVVALALLAARHPVRCLLDVARRAPGDPSLTAIAPAAVRLERGPATRVHALGSGRTAATARRIAALAGQDLTAPPRSSRPGEGSLRPARHG